MRIWVSILLAYFFVTVMNAQDVLFTQLYGVPTYLNPANTGMMDGNYRFTAVYRDQWSDQLNSSYRSFSGALDMRITPKFSENDKIGFGLTFFGDQNGEVPVRQNRVMFQAAYHKALGFREKSVLSLGFYFGPSQRNVSYSQLVFFDQLDRGGPNAPTAERLPQNNVSFADIGLGLAYKMKRESFEGGLALSASHLNRPNQSQYLNEDDPPIQELVPSFQLQFWGEFNLIPGQLWLTPRGTIYTQDNIRIYQPGGFLSMSLGRSDQRIHAGITSRMGNSFDQSFDIYDAGLLFGIEFSTFNIGVSYDLNLNIQNTFAQQQGTFEFSIGYIGDTKETPKRGKPIF